MNENKEINDVIYMLKIRFSISEITKMTLCFFFILLSMFSNNYHLYCYLYFQIILKYTLLLII